MTGAWLPAIVLLSSLVPGVVIFFLRERSVALRTALNIAGAVVKLVAVVIMVFGVYHGLHYELRIPLLPGLDFVLHTDALALLFLPLSTFLWLVTTVYAIAYLEGAPHRSRFFGFFCLCVSATVGLAMAGNLLTFVVFYEALSLATYPLVVHRGTAKARRAGRIYLAYTLTGGAVLLFGAVWVHALAGPVDFTPHGVLAGTAGAPTLTALFWVLIAGAGVKAALLPLHSWLPIAMVAPAPVSALLHAVAVVKAGAFGIVRIVFDVFGVELTAELGVAVPLAALASATVIYGSLQALVQDDLKHRLAFSTVSQVSYIALGAALAGPLAAVGGIVHLVHQGLMKVTLFFCAGNLSETLGVQRVSELDGVGWRMPWTMAAFTVAAVAMIGVPPMAGFISKWYLGLGALDVGQTWVVAVLLGSSALNAAYFLPPLYRAWFKTRRRPWPTLRRGSGDLETHWALLAPPLITALAAVAVGLFAAFPGSPLVWVELIVERVYGL